MKMVSLYWIRGESGYKASLDRYPLFSAFQRSYESLR